MLEHVPKPLVPKGPGHALRPPGRSVQRSTGIAVDAKWERKPVAWRPGHADAGFDLGTLRRTAAPARRLPRLSASETSQVRRRKPLHPVHRMQRLFCVSHLEPNAEAEISAQDIIKQRVHAERGSTHARSERDLGRIPV